MFLNFVRLNWVSRVLVLLCVSSSTVIAVFQDKYSKKLYRDGRLLLGSIGRSRQEFDIALDEYTIYSDQFKGMLLDGFNSAVENLRALCPGSFNLPIVLDQCNSYVKALVFVAEKADILNQRAARAVLYWADRGQWQVECARIVARQMAQEHEFWNELFELSKDRVAHYWSLNDAEIKGNREHQARIDDPFIMVVREGIENKNAIKLLVELNQLIQERFA